MDSMSSNPNDADIPPCESTPTPSSTKSIWGKAKETLSEASSHATKVAALSSAATAKAAQLGKQSVDGALETGKHVYAGSQLESAVNYIDGELDQRGAKKAIKDTAGAVVDKLD